MTDRKVRLLKTLSWSLITFGITTVVGWVLVGSLLKGGLIGVACRVIKVPTYFVHDAAWDKIKKKAQEPSIVPEMG